MLIEARISISNLLNNPLRIEDAVFDSANDVGMKFLGMSNGFGALIDVFREASLEEFLFA